jgi:uncharacterized membrane protein YphA (DoxX/SURF4 family)
MQIVLLIAMLIIGGLLNLAKKASFRFVYNLGVAYIFIILLVSIRSWFLYNTIINNAFLAKALLFQVNFIGSLGHLILGYLIVNIFLLLTSTESNDLAAKKLIGLTLWGITILTGFSFLTETYGMAENCCKMMTFFTASGYNLWFLYFIMIAETLGGLGVLLHFKLKTGPVAAAGLMLIMICALYTHNHNNDPFSDSYAALCQFIMLAIMQALYYFKQQGNAMQINATQQSSF